MSLVPFVAISNVDEHRILVREKLARAGAVDLLDLGLDLL
jgi:hypothetical protein